MHRVCRYVVVCVAVLLSMSTTWANVDRANIQISWLQEVPPVIQVRVLTEGPNLWVNFYNRQGDKEYFLGRKQTLGKLVNYPISQGTLPPGTLIVVKVYAPSGSQLEEKKLVLPSQVPTPPSLPSSDLPSPTASATVPSNNLQTVCWNAKSEARRTASLFLNTYGRADRFWHSFTKGFWVTYNSQALYMNEHGKFLEGKNTGIAKGKLLGRAQGKAQGSANAQEEAKRQVLDRIRLVLDHSGAVLEEQTPSISPGEGTLSPTEILASVSPEPLLSVDWQLWNQDLQPKISHYSWQEEGFVVRLNTPELFPSLADIYGYKGPDNYPVQKHRPNPGFAWKNWVETHRFTYESVPSANRTDYENCFLEEYKNVMEQRYSSFVAQLDDNAFALGATYSQQVFMKVAAYEGHKQGLLEGGQQGFTEAYKPSYEESFRAAFASTLDYYKHHSVVRIAAGRLVSQNGSLEPNAHVGVAELVITNWGGQPIQTLLRLQGNYIETTHPISVSLPAYTSKNLPAKELADLAVLSVSIPLDQPLSFTLQAGDQSEYLPFTLSWQNLLQAFTTSQNPGTRDRIVQELRSECARCTSTSENCYKGNGSRLSQLIAFYQEGTRTPAQRSILSSLRRDLESLEKTYFPKKGLFWKTHTHPFIHSTFEGLLKQLL